MPTEAERLLPILKKLSFLLPEKTSVVLSIDGRCASGKTTMASQLSRLLPSGIVHMDDFFLPQDLRTAERFSEPGGNVDYERFLSEVLPFLSSGEAFTYRKFDCSVMDFSGTVTVPAGKYRIVEGAYSLHPKFGKYYDLAVFADIKSDEQMKRITKRNGPESAIVFCDRWIPLEEDYFRTCRIKERADITV